CSQILVFVVFWVRKVNKYSTGGNIFIHQRSKLPPLKLPFFASKPLVLKLYAAHMNIRKAGLLSLIILTIVCILHLLDMKGVMSFDRTFLMTSRWILVG